MPLPESPSPARCSEPSVCMVVPAIASVTSATLALSSQESRDDDADALAQRDVLVLGRAHLGLQRCERPEHQHDADRAQPVAAFRPTSCTNGPPKIGPTIAPMGRPALMSAAVRPRSSRRHAAERPGQSGRPRDGAEDAGREAHADELGERSDEGVQRRRDPEQQRGGDRDPPRAEAVGEVSRRHGGEQHGRAVGADDDARLRLAQVQRLLPARQQRRDREPEHEIEEDERADERREPARPPALHCLGRHGLGQGRRQSIGSAPCSASIAFARRERLRAEEPVVRRERARMRALDAGVRREQRLEGAGVAAPEDRHERLVAQSPGPGWPAP